MKHDKKSNPPFEKRGVVDENTPPPRPLATPVGTKQASDPVDFTDAMADLVAEKVK